MPTYVLPTFNLNVNIYRNALGPPPIAAAPSVVTVGNLSVGMRVNVIGAYNIGFEYLLLPALTDIRDNYHSTPSPQFDWCEVPAGSGRFYLVEFVADVSKGFATEHRMARLLAQTPWPLPYP